MRRKKIRYASCKRTCNETHGNDDERQRIGIGTADVRLLLLYRVGNCDMENLEYRHIQTAADGQRYIRKERQNTKVEFMFRYIP